MSPLALLRVALQSLRRNPVRSALTLLGVVIGVGAVIVMVAIGNGATAEIEGKINSLGTHLIVVTPGSTTRGGLQGGAGSQSSLSLPDAEQLAREGVAFDLVSPVIVAPTRAVYGNVNWRTNALGVNLDYLTIRSWPLLDGRPFDEADLRSRRKVCLLGGTVADTLFAGDDPIGKSVRMRGVLIEVIGTLARKGQTAEGTDQDDVILLPATTVQTRLAGRQFIAQILVSATHEAAVEPAKREVAEILREAHGLSPRDEDDFTVKDQRQLAEAAQSATRVMTLLLLVVASVSLLVGGIGIMNIMLVSVTERTREIGLRRALGARKRDVMAQFLIEAIVLSAMGGLIGAALGVGVARLVGEATGWSTPITAGSILLAMGFSAAVGVFFGWFPARRAAALDPIDALRFQ